MNIFLEHLSKEFFDYFIIIQLDQAGWHKSKQLKVPENIRVLYQPPYSPELNPVEHIWEELREKYLHNKYFDSIDQVVEAVCQAIVKLSADIQKIISMTYFPYLRMIL